MAGRGKRPTKTRKPFVPPPPGLDVVMTVEDVMQLLKKTRSQVYHHNDNGDFPVHKQGKECRYLYSEVMSAFMNSDTRIKDDPSLQRDYTIDELPKCWPTFGQEDAPQEPDEKSDEKPE